MASRASLAAVVVAVVLVIGIGTGSGVEAARGGAGFGGRVNSAAASAAIHGPQRIRVPIRKHAMPHPYSLASRRSHPPTTEHVRYAKGLHSSTTLLAQSSEGVSGSDAAASVPLGGQYLHRHRKFRSPFAHAGHIGRGHSGRTPHTSGATVPAPKQDAPLAGNGTDAGGGGDGGSGSGGNSTSGGGDDHRDEIELRDYYSIVYTGPIAIGTPTTAHPDTQEFWCVFDTGSADLWVFSSQTQAAKHDFLHYYDHTHSSSYVALPDRATWSITYGRGQVEGSMSQDNVRIGHHTVVGQQFAEAKQYTSNFANENQPLDGIVGFAFAGATNDGRTATLVDNLAAQHLIPSRKFSFYLTAATDTGAAAEFLLGEPDARYYNGQMLWVDVLLGSSPTPRMWFLSLDALAIDTTVIESPDDHVALDGACAGGRGTRSCVCLPDTGTSFLTVPSRVWPAIKQAILAARSDCQEVSNVDAVVCLQYAAKKGAGLPSISYKVGGTWLTVTGDDYLLPVSDSEFGSQPVGQVGIQPFDSNSGHPSAPDMFILGDVFLRAYYTVFDMDAAKVGFAHAPDANSALPNWVKALIVLACVVVLFAACILIGHFRKRRDAAYGAISPPSANASASANSAAARGDATQAGSFAVVAAPPLSTRSGSVIGGGAAATAIPLSQRTGGYVLGSNGNSGGASTAPGAAATARSGGAVGGDAGVTGAPDDPTIAVSRGGGSGGYTAVPVAAD